jgi:hypothetical protein
MRIRLAFSILPLLLLSALSPCQAQDKSGLAILDFSWSRWQKPLNAEVDFGSAPTAARPPMSDEDKKIVERRYGDLVRSAELRKIERDAAGNNIRPGAFYNYKVKVKNSEAKAIKIIYWEYQFKERSDPDNISRRQFGCFVKVKANEQKGLIGISASPPTRVISAKTLGSNSPKPFEESATINRIEYADGTIWQRKDWNPPPVLQIPPANVPGGIRHLECIGL